MATALWIAFDVFLTWRTQVIKGFPPKELVIWIIAAFFVASFSWGSEHSDAATISHLSSTTDSMSKQLILQSAEITGLRQQVSLSEDENKASNDENKASQHQLIALVEDIVANTPEGLKKQALQLSADLDKFAADNQHVDPRAGRFEWEQAFLHNSLQPEEKAKRIKAWQDVLQKAQEQQKRDDEAAKVAYHNSFAARVTAVRAKLIEAGRKQWSHDSSYYQNPQSTIDLWSIASELATNAQALP
jgi:hypothetical protein